MQFELELRLYGFTLQLCRMLAADLDDAKLTIQLTPQANHPAWILGHLAVATDYALQTMGQRRVCSKEWHEKFGIRSKPCSERSNYPTKDELLSAVERGHELVTNALKDVSPERFSAPNPVDFLEKPLPTVGDLLAHLMTTHVAFHLGQLSMWRRQMGFAPIV
ncbi:MAG TPA: DinB family protein [Gemmataceae bacterium]|nr:DinB family protein [Gemmataceae bacterium]